MIETWCNLFSLSACVLAALASTVVAVVTLPRVNSPTLTGDDPRVWACLAVGWGEFALIKSANAIQLLGDLLRTEAHHEGLYNGRRPFQWVAVVLIALTTCVLLGVLLRPVTGRWQRYRAPVSVFILVTGFALIRFVSLHTIDALGPVLLWSKMGVEVTAVMVTVGSAYFWCFSASNRMPVTSRDRKEAV